MKSYKLNNTDLDLVLTNKKACIKNNDINDKLIKTKKKIDEFPEQWEKYKKHYNKYEYIYISNNSKKNICKINPISRSFFKLHEIIKDYNLLYNKNKNTITCIAEGPGGFIQSLLYNTEQKNIEIENIYGITLLSKNKKVPSWNNMIINNKDINILDGVKKNGDICDIDNIKSFIKTIGENSCDIVTGDGGIDFSVDYNKQEELSYNFIFYEILITLHIQKNGGSCVIKMFDLIHINTLQLLYILRLCYNEVYINKPVTSRSTNSEKYIICKGYKRNNNILLLLRKYCYLINDFCIDIPDSFIKEINDYNNIFINMQINNIENIISLINEKKELETSYETQTTLAKEWCKTYDLPINI